MGSYQSADTNDRAKAVAFRVKDREALKRAISEEMAKQDWEAALALANASIFGPHSSISIAGLRAAASLNARFRISSSAALRSNWSSERCIRSPIA